MEELVPLRRAEKRQEGDRRFRVGDGCREEILETAQQAQHRGRFENLAAVFERSGETVHVTPIEYRLLTHLAAHPHCVLTHRQLLNAVWGPNHSEDTHYLRVYMGQLRKKIEHDPAQPRHLVTETGIGYRFVP